MKVLHIITGLPKAAGTSTFCGEVCNQLAALGHDVTIAVLNPSAPDIYPLDPRVHLVSIESIFHSTPNTYTLIHIHGLWSPVLHKVSCWGRSRQIPIVWSTHGMTAPWALKHKWWKKCIPWCLYQKRDLKRAKLIHCTSDFEIEWNHKLGFERTFLAPLGTFLPEKKVANSIADIDLRPRPKILLFVGRIYPVKALDRLIIAFQSVSHVGWKLRIVGPDQAGHLVDLKKIAGNDVEFPGPRFGEELQSEYEQCDCLALVSHTENFGATVIDALVHGKPVITSTKTPWKIVSGRGCGFWVDNDVETLSAALLQLFNLSAIQLSEMGVNGRKLAEERYSWAAVAKTLGEVYERTRQ